MLRRVIFVSEKQAEQMRGRQSAAIISIVGADKALPALSSGWHSVLHLIFDDVDPITFPNANQSLQQMTRQQAGEIASFITGLPNTVCTLVIHCKSGISRSAGVAKAVAEHYRLRFPRDYKEHNRFAYDLVLKWL